MLLWYFAHEYHCFVLWVILMKSFQLCDWKVSLETVSGWLEPIPTSGKHISTLHSCFFLAFMQVYYISDLPVGRFLMYWTTATYLLHAFETQPIIKHTFWCWCHFDIVIIDQFTHLCVAAQSKDNNCPCSKPMAILVSSPGYHFLGWNFSFNFFFLSHIEVRKVTSPKMLCRKKKCCIDKVTLSLIVERHFSWMQMFISY